MKYNFVVLNVGNLDNIIAQVLYNSFSKVMNGRIIVRGTPATLRAAYIRLLGMGDMQNTVVLCSEYRNDSKPLGDKIKQKFKFEPVGVRGPIDVI
ncbi:MAG: hypothetical protein LBM93_14765 [Oscillospiraceae bacterium]|nr:hypothetical protein [Oscillospiraceae bacterium]